MENAVALGVVYIGIGILLLFFGWRFVKLVVGLLGLLIGMWIGQVVADLFNVTGGLAFAIILLVAIAIALLSVAFYKFVIALQLSVLVFTLSYGVIHSMSDSFVASMIVALILAFLAFLIIQHYQLIETAIIFVAAMQGASAIGAGAAILLDHSRTIGLLHGPAAVITNTASTPWIVAWIALALLGIVVQLRSKAEAKT